MMPLTFDFFAKAETLKSGSGQLARRSLALRLGPDRVETFSRAETPFVLPPA